MAQLFWLMLLMLVVMYMFAVVLSQGALAWLRPYEDEEKNAAHEQYRNVEQYFGIFYFSVFLFFVFFSIFSVMNIVTGVFVDGAIQHVSNDRKMVLEQHLQNK